jgi:alpha-beta hydrolase superfamily lysophospholipase
VAEALGPALGIDILALDFRGHGRSPGRRGYVRRYGELVADLHAALGWAERARPGRARFVLGHSNGGLVALRALLERQEEIAGLIVSNPAVRLAGRVPRHKRVAGAVLRRVAPWVTLATDVGPEKMTRDPAMLTERETDPLRHTRISAQIYYGMVEGGPYVQERAGLIRTPTLMILSGADPVIDSKGSQELFDELGSADKTLRIYPGMLHEPLNELGREQVLSDVTAWLENHLPQPCHEAL